MLNKRKELIRTIENLPDDSIDHASDEIEIIAQRALRKAKSYQYKKPSIVPELPASGIPPYTNENGCQWLDDYVEYASAVSPRSYRDYLVTSGVLLLSGVAARRVNAVLSKKIYTNLYAMLVGNTSMYSKTGALETVNNVMSKAGLDFLIGADEKTPQVFIKNMTAWTPPDFDNWKVEQQKDWMKRLPLANASIWLPDEFGRVIRGMTSRGGAMEGWWGLLRQVYNCPPTYRYETIKHGSMYVERPHLAMLGSMTPKDLIDTGKKGHEMWGDGSWARYCFVCPPSNEPGSRARWRRVSVEVPDSVTQPLINWHQRLGIPKVRIEQEVDERTGKETGKKSVHYYSGQSEHSITLSEQVYELYYKYDDALKDLVEHPTQIVPSDLHGCYTRLTLNALKVAALFCSLEGLQEIELKHWYKAWNIAEMWRSGLHNLYEQVNEKNISDKRTLEQEILIFLEEKGGEWTIRQMKQYNRRIGALSSQEIKQVIKSLVDEGEINERKEGRSYTYTL